MEGEIASGDEAGPVAFDLFVIVILVAFNGGILDLAVHPIDLSIGPWMFGLGRRLLDIELW
jgi:hypothetical protein